jgi:hypothetical protein
VGRHVGPDRIGSDFGQDRSRSFGRPGTGGARGGACGARGADGGVGQIQNPATGAGETLTAGGSEDESTRL